MASWAGWYWRGPRCWRCRCGATTRHAPLGSAGEENGSRRERKTGVSRACAPGMARPQPTGTYLRRPRKSCFAIGACGLGLIQLHRRKPVAAQQLEQSALTHEVQRPHDHQAVALAMQELLDLRQPALVAPGHQLPIERREGAVLARQESPERGAVAAAPGAEHLLHLAQRLLELTQRLVQQPQLVLARQRLQTRELLGQSLQARG